MFRLFSIFTADFPNSLRHTGVPLGNVKIRYLLYADDLVLLAPSAPELQKALTHLEEYTSRYRLSVNVTKTKCMVFYKGYCPKSSFFYNGIPLELCTNFTYLGVVLSTRLSSSKHIDHVLAKANAKVGFLFARLPLREISLQVVLDIFHTYILPIVMYALPIWFPSMTENASKRLNSLFTKYLKRYLGLPYLTNNAIVHFLTDTSSLCDILRHKLLKATLNISYPAELDGVRILPLPNETLNNCPYNPIPSIPTYFWLSTPLVGKIPVLEETRRSLLYEMIDITHFHICKTKDFHLEPDIETCLCRFCNGPAYHYHHRECAPLMHLSHSALMRATFTKEP